MFLQRLPEHVQELLSVVEGVELNKLAEVADKAMDRRRVPHVATISNSDNHIASDLAALAKQISKLSTRLECSDNPNKGTTAQTDSTKSTQQDDKWLELKNMIEELAKQRRSYYNKNQQNRSGGRSRSRER
ncbi:uncharacterized protein LOC112494471 [Cephus cinctus]|uniref:Uncharacterized protein LOC112494471 n=1 Tax=Cephus cinctus TaxID=211228 RepID=A0AAJ7RJI7_CEPCN|nr:uncharacterized protein LOC112494471 [Cephus cinctus]